MLGVVIHKRLFLSPQSTKMCLECTVLANGGDIHSIFQNYLFSVEVITSYVVRSKSNVIVCELEDDCPDGYECMGFPLSQPGTGYPLSQPGTGYPLSQPGAGFPLSQQDACFPLSQPRGDYLMRQLGYGIQPMSQCERISYGIAEDGMQAGL